MAQRTLHEIFTCYIFDHIPTLGEVINECGWGSNREIRQKGFRVDTEFSLQSPYFSNSIRKINKINDPKFMMKHGFAIMTTKGDKVIVVKVKQ